MLAGENAPASTTPPEDYGSTVKMSPFEVMAEGLEFRDWSKLSSPHFVLYTDADTDTATTLVKDMEMAHQAAQFYLHRRSVNLAPMIIVLPTTMSDWRKIASKGLLEWKPGASTVGLLPETAARPARLAKRGLGADVGGAGRARTRRQ